MTTKYSSIIFDLGDVLFSWSAETTTTVSSSTLRRILSSPTWFEYERGKLSEDECCARVASEHAIDPKEVQRAFHQARESLKADDRLVHLIEDLRAQHGDQLRIYAMSNISLPDYEMLRSKSTKLSIFDDIFASGAVGERKPDLGFYKHVIKVTNADPLRTIFVDDKHENVLSARSLGLQGIVYDSFDNVERSLRNLLGYPISRGQDYLRNNAGRLDSITEATAKNPSVALKENFTQLLILEATNDESLVHLVEHPRTWNFFQGRGQLNIEDFPFDIDTTSVALTVLKHDKSVVSSIMDEMLECVNSDGIIQTYFDHSRPRFDPVVCANALSLFFANGRESDLYQTYEWVCEVLRNRAYLSGTRYYESPECFLFSVSRILSCSDNQDLHAAIKPLLRKRVQERIGTDGDSLALSMRILACDAVGIRNETDLQALLKMQCVDGGWEMGWFYRFGSSGMRVGNRGLSTALAIKAIEAMSSPRPPTVNTPSPQAKPITHSYRWLIKNFLTPFWSSIERPVKV